MRKKIAIFMTMVMTLTICFILQPITSEASTYTFDVSGTPWILTTLEDYSITLKVGDNDVLYLDKDDRNLASDGGGIINIGIDTNTNTIYVLDSNHVIRWWNYDLQKHDSIIYNFITTSTDENNLSYVDEVADLIIDYSNNQRLITGYEKFSGEVCPLLTYDQIQKYLENPNEPIINPSPTPTAPTPTPVVPTPTPSTPAPTPNNSNTSPSPTTNPTVTPSNTDTTNVTPTPVVTKKSVKKKAGYSCLSVGSKVTSKYKLTKGKLTWKGNGKSKKFSGIKSAGFIKKSGNLVFMTKQGKVYTLSSRGKKKCIVKKKAKKLIIKNKFVVKVKVGKKFINLANK